MYYPMGVAYPFAYDDPWGTQSHFSYPEIANAYTANGGYHNGGYYPY